MEYNWDDIQVGDCTNPEAFFSQKHIMHEKHVDAVDRVAKEIENFKLDSKDKPIIVIATEQVEISTEEIKIKEKNISYKSITEELVDDLPANDKNEENIPNNQQILESTPPLSLHNVSIETAFTSIKKDRKTPANLLKKPWSAVKCLNKANIRQIPNIRAPHAYEFKDIYQNKKEEIIRKQLEEDKKKRIFHSRPVPNFSAFHSQLEKRKNSHRITTPVTPNVLKKSKEVEAKRREKWDELKRTNEQYKFTSRQANVLQEEPFKPKKFHTALPSKPFNLHSDKRLEERKRFDEKFKRTLEDKKKQEEDERKIREDEEAKELRKLATFKARPNPFK